MSLLMEALKKAEEAKRLGGESLSATMTAAPPITQSGDPATPPSGDSPLPKLSQHINAVDTDLAAVSTTPPVRHSQPGDRTAAERTAARNLFAAKQAPKSNTGLWLLGGTGIIAALCLGGYFWWQLQAIPSHGLARAPAALPPATLAPTPPTVTAGGDASRPRIESLTSTAPAPDSSRTPASLFAKATTAPAPREERTNSPPAAPPQRETGDPAVRLSRTPLRTNMTLERAYDTLQAGKLDEAQREYEQVLRSDAKNTDALLGLATIAAQRGQSEKAQTFYLRALESNPNDATAQAGVISTRGQADADFSESRLKTSLASQPDSPALLFALGNLYARQGRWSEAQQVYFRTYATEPDNPDFIFNLAVSLDHLRQNKLAGQYYQMALTAGETRTVSFDRDQARTRILELQQ